ncbi:MAG: hypothetical protein AAFP92_11785, partial [Bacteroidota bacterium]
ITIFSKPSGSGIHPAYLQAWTMLSGQLVEQGGVSTVTPQQKDSPQGSEKRRRRGLPFYLTWKGLTAIFSSRFLIFLHTFGAWVYPLLRLIPGRKILLFLPETITMEPGKNFLSYLLGLIREKLAVSLAHEILVNNPAVGERITSRYGKRAHYLPLAFSSPVLPEKMIFPEKVDPQKPYIFCHWPAGVDGDWEMVLKAFAQYPRYPLVMVASWQRTRQAQQLFNHYQAYQNLILLEESTVSASLTGLMQQAFAYVHADRNGGTSPYLVQAMSLGKAILCLDLPQHRETTGFQAAYFRHATQLISFLADHNRTYFKDLGLKMLQQTRFQQDATESQERILRLLHPPQSPLRIPFFSRRKARPSSLPVK